MGCGCGKKGNLPQRQNVIKPAIIQNVVRSIGTNQPQTQQTQSNVPMGMDKNRLEIEKKRREAIKKSLGKML